MEQLEGTLYRAQALGENAVFYNDPDVINTSSNKIRSVTKEDIQKVARTYLIESNRTVVVTTPKPRAGGVQLLTSVTRQAQRCRQVSGPGWTLAARTAYRPGSSTTSRPAARDRHSPTRPRISS